MVTNAGYRSLRAAGLGTEAATAAVLEVLRGRPGLAVHELGPGRISVARTRRPGWAVGACVATIWLLGLGLLFLLVRRTESGEVVVAAQPQGCTVTVPPLLDVAAVQAIEAALAGPLAVAPPAAPLPPPPPPAPAPAPVAGDLEDRTVARGESPAARPAGPHVALRFDGGTVTVAPGRRVVLGRDPSSGAEHDEPRIVPGDAGTVSKSHLRVAFDGTTATVEDLGSTNGSWLVRADGDVPLAPGMPSPVPSGGRVRAGAVVFTVDHVGGADG